ncbi:MAG TPA: glycine oxidase ThiO [Candidatus Sulfotelmatobacter sp.]|nr:glycine oxidase ThiO [Candidatus Sulfotelmatobacter sp.]
MNTYDAVVAGGGLIGASIALELAEAGMKVGLYDAREPGREASWASAGMISPAPENPGMIPFVPMSLASVALYPEFIRKVEELTGMDVGYRKDGALDVIVEGDAQKELSTIIALQHGVGLRAEALNAEQAREMEPSLTEETQAAVFRPDEASLDARVFTEAVLEAAGRKGVQIFAGNGAKAVWKEGARCRGLVLEKGQAEAKWTIIAAGCFSARIAGVELYAPVFPAKGQMLALRCESVEIQRVLWLEHTYLVPRNDGRIIAGSTIERTGFDHDVTAGGMKKILSEALQLVPGLEKARIEETWAGLRPDSLDHLPIIGPTDVDGLLIATGHFRSGILLAPVTARLIREWVTKQRVSVDWGRVSPMRFLEAKGRKVVSSQL